MNALFEFKSIPGEKMNNVKNDNKKSTVIIIYFDPAF